MANFMLLLYDNPEKWKTLSPEEMQKALEKYISVGPRAVLPWIANS